MSNFNSARPSLTLGEAVSSVFSKYATFTGRARRSEYWWFYLFYVVVLIAAVVLDNLLNITFDYSFYGPIYCIAGLVFVLPFLAVSIRRLHDIGKSGWNILWGIIPIIGFIVLLVWAVTDSQTGSNKYGESPKYQG